MNTCSADPFRVSAWAMCPRAHVWHARQDRNRRSSRDHGCKPQLSGCRLSVRLCVNVASCAKRSHPRAASTTYGAQLGGTERLVARTTDPLLSPGPPPSTRGGRRCVCPPGPLEGEWHRQPRERRLQHGYARGLHSATSRIQARQPGEGHNCASHRDVSCIHGQAQPSGSDPRFCTRHGESKLMAPGGQPYSKERNAQQCVQAGPTQHRREAR